MNIVSFFLLFLLSFSFYITSQKSVFQNSIDLFDQALFEWSGVWAEVAQHAKEKHYKVESIEQAMIEAIDAFVSALDPHSSFLDTKSYNAIIEKTAGEFCGVGIMINTMRSTKDKFLTIVDVIPDGPAAKSGIMQYDKIIEIDCQLIDGMTTEEAISLLKGKKDTKVAVTILREGSPDLLTMTITRDIIKEQQSLCFYIPDKNIYYLSLSTFAQNSTQQLEHLLKQTQRNNPKGLILDLRNNSGGLLNVAIDIAGLFLDKNSIVVTTKNNKDETTATYKTTNNPIKNKNLIICILINNYTASAAEVLAGALQVHADKKDQKTNLMVFIVGTPSFGKGSVQEVMPIGKNCALKLTTSLYFLPYDTMVQGIGIQPDIYIERYTPPSEHSNWLTDSYGKESTLSHSISLEKKEKKPNRKKCTEKNTAETTPISHKKQIEAILQKDNQIKEAINVISLVYHGQKNLPTVVTDRKTALYFLKHNYVYNSTIEIEEIILTKQ